MNDLSTISCDAALELDNLHLRRPDMFTNVQRVLNWLSALCESERQAPCSDVLRTLILWETYQRMLLPFLSLTYTDDVLRMAATTIQCLTNLCSDPPRFAREHPAALQSLITFCLELSRVARARGRSWRYPRCLVLYG